MLRLLLKTSDDVIESRTILNSQIASFVDPEDDDPDNGNGGSGSGSGSGSGGESGTGTGGGTGLK